MRNFFNLYFFELRQNYRSLLIWFASLTVVLILFMSIFPSMSNSDFMDIFNAKINALPKELISTFGLGSYINLKDILFFFAYIFQFMVIAMIIYAVDLSSDIISKEHMGKHIDYLASKPIKKETIIASKYAAVLTLIAVLSLLILIASFILIQIYNQTSNLYLHDLWRLFSKVFLIYVFFGTLAVFVSIMLKKTTRSNMIVLAIFFITYALGAMSNTVEKFDKLRYLSPYYMFETAKAYREFSSTDVIYILILISLSLLLIIASIFRYENKDLSL